MFPGNYDIQEYYASPQGQFVFQALSKRILKMWPLEELHDTTLTGVGFTFPYLDLYAECPENVNKQKEKNATKMNHKSIQTFAIVSKRSGLYYWPEGQDNRTVICRRGEWPFPKESVDRILIVHDAEYASGMAALLSEVWRVLKPNGRVLMVLPNRTGLWVRSDQNPFGHGAPYSLSQLRTTLRENHFVYEGACGALLTPPFKSKVMLKTAGFLMEPFARFCTSMSGVQVVEASKRLYAPTGKREPFAQNIRKIIWPVPSGSKPIAG